MLKEGKRGQVSIFIIVALLIVLGVGTYFAVRSETAVTNPQGEFSEIYSYYQQCIEQYTTAGLSIAASKGGRIDDGSFTQGSNYAPFGSHLVVAGVPVRYWTGLSGNGMIELAVPTQNDVERELENYIASRLIDCNFDSFRNQGLEIGLDVTEVETRIASDGIIVRVDSPLSVKSENSSVVRDNFETTIQSDFGSLFQDALKIHQKQENELFLENYSFDVLRLYAPVDGVEIQCSPKVWVAQDVFGDLKNSLDSNLESIELSKSSEKDYFNLQLDVENDAQILYDSNWPSRFEVYGNKGNLLVAEPVGNQAGLQAMGFCYVPYHFVYDMFFPVVIRLSSDNEFFQFPVVVLIDKNTPRAAGDSIISEDTENQDLCEAATQDLRVSVRGDSGGIANASVSYGCFDQSCDVGNTNDDGVVVGKVPACLNGYIAVDAPGYAATNELFSSHNSSVADVRLEKEYSVSVSLKVDGKSSNSLAFISLQGEKGTKQATIPDSKFVSLSAGFYNVSVYQYGNASIRIPASTTRQCIEVSAGGLTGLFGATKEQCFDIPIPETVIDRALTAGGQGEVYLPVELLEKGNLVLTVTSLPKPTGIESLENNYALFEVQGVDIEYE